MRDARIKPAIGSTIVTRTADQRTILTHRPRYILHLENTVAPKDSDDDRVFRDRFAPFQWQATPDDTPAVAPPPSRLSRPAICKRRSPRRSLAAIVTAAVALWLVIIAVVVA